MLIFDQLKKDDRQLRVVALGVLAGLAMLLAGLWWVQIVSARDYQEHLENQSFRTVRIPAVRGKILDRDGVVLAENRPTYNVSLYLEELRGRFDTNYFAKVARARDERQRQAEAEAKRLNRSLTKEERKQFVLTTRDKLAIRQQARCEIASNVILQLGQHLEQPLVFNPTNFERHYETRLALPFPVLTNLSPLQIARFEEQCAGSLGIDLVIQSTRVYPYETTAAHVLGCLQSDPSSKEGESSFFSYYLPDFRGILGVEWGYDKALRGMAGDKSVLVNNVGYRQSENIWIPAEAGSNVVLTLDLRIQQAAEQALQAAPLVSVQPVHGAAVVLDVNTGEILAMASTPTVNPNDPVRGYTAAELERRKDPALRPEVNRATQENYQPGSIFKLVVAMAALENGWDPNAIFNAPENPREPGKAMAMVGPQTFRDLAPPGPYNLRRAIVKSSNAYFINCGLHTGIERVVEIGHRLHLGEFPHRDELDGGVLTRQDKPGNFPSFERIHSHWRDGDTANLCIGQGEVDMTPLQAAVMLAAIANGGKVLWPRLVREIAPPEPAPGQQPLVFPPEVRGELGVKPETLRLLREAMNAEVEGPEGTGRAAFIPGFAISGKTGTAEKKNQRGQLEEHITWFASFAPYEHPRYAVVVMVEGGNFGGTTCAPVANKIYTAIVERERAKAAQNVVRAN